MQTTKIFVLVFLFLFTLDASELVKRTKVMMGTYVSVSLEQKDIYLSNLTFNRLKDIELSLSSYDSNALVYKLNHTHTVTIDADLYEALILSSKYYKTTNGYFDITIGSITKSLFHFGEKELIPSTKELQSSKINFKGIIFNKRNASIEQGVVLDLGGMGKGFGVDKAKEVLLSKGVKKAVIALSGDIYCIGRCSMSIQNPFKEEILASFKIIDAAISTSGNYRRFVKNKEFNHLINPKKKKSQKTFASISLVSKSMSNSDLDAYATAASVMPYHKSISFLNSIKELGYIVVKNDKTVIVSKNFSKLVCAFEFYKSLEQPKREYIIISP